MVTIWDLLVNLGSIGFIICTIPQAVQTWKTQSAGDISWLFLVMVLASSGMMLPYLLHRQEWLFATAQAVNILVWGMVAVFKGRAGKGRTTAGKSPTQKP